MKRIVLTIVAIILCGIMLISLTGCGTDTNETTNDTVNNTTANQDEVPKANYSIEECIKLIEPENTIEEMTEIIGFEPEKSEYTGKYTWKFDSKNQIEVTDVSDDIIIQATIDKSTIKNDSVDLSCYDELAEALGQGNTFSYEEIVDKVGGVEGTLAGKTADSKRYIWVDGSDVTFAATIDNEDGKVSIISMR